VAETYEDLVREHVEKSRPRGVPAAPARIIPVLTPTLGVASFWYFTGIMDLIWPMNTSKAVIPMPDRVGGEIAEMRNRLVSMCLALETERQTVHSLFWVDDDVIINRACLLKLASHDRDIASGVYFAKGDLGEPLIFGGPCSGTLPFRPDETFEAWGWAQGLSLVKTEVYKRMRDELDLGKDRYGCPLWYEPSDFRVDKETGAVCVNGTEDFPFFQKANDLGYKCLVDCTQHAFGFHYDALRQVGYPRAQWEQHVRREPVVWPAQGGRKEVVWS